MSKKKNLEEIWEEIYFDKGTDETGVICTHFSHKGSGILGEYEIKDDVFEVIIYKEYYEDENKKFDDTIIDGAIKERLEDLELSNETKLKISFAK